MIIKTDKIQSRKKLNSIQRADFLFSLHEKNYILFEKQILNKENNNLNNIKISKVRNKRLVTILDLPPIILTINHVSNYTHDCLMKYENIGFKHSHINLFPFEVSFRAFSDAKVLEFHSIDEYKKKYQSKKHKIIDKTHIIKSTEQKIAQNLILSKWLIMIKNNYHE